MESFGRRSIPKIDSREDEAFFMRVAFEGRRKVTKDPLVGDSSAERTSRRSKMERRKFEAMDEIDDASSSEREEEKKADRSLISRLVENSEPMTEISDASSSERRIETFRESPDPNVSSFSWEMYSSEIRSAIEESRKDFSKIYREGMDDRTAIIKAIMTAIGPRPVLGSLGEADMARKSMRLHSRHMEENGLMRTAVLELGERSCGRDDECVLRQAFGKSAVEYLDAKESLAKTETGDLPSRRKACLSCVRDDVVWYWMFLHHRGEARNGYISGHYNAVEVIGEYRIDQCLHDPSYGLPLPVVASNLGYLRPEEGFTLEGHRTTYFRQEGYLKIENARDFP